MTAQASSLKLSPRTVRLAVAGCMVATLLYLALAITAGALDARGQIAELETSSAAISAQETATTRLGSRRPAPEPRQALIASSKEAAIASIQHSLQDSIEPPAKLESLHILDVPDEKGVTIVRASIRVRNLAPERVTAFIRRIEGTVPAIVFDDLRISIHTRPGLIGPAGPGAETSTADVSGVVRTYATSMAVPLFSGTAGRQP